ncbi:DUF397 domain-containing protein [Streptomyces sp. NPDC059835]|uniref:DUF397 domain-containing protein n=1 Tax=Streptomyces sp. NPDC059835 TaxID=3346967 RepID=UPI00364B4FC2
MNSSQLRWFKSSYSGSEGDDCVEVAACTDAIHIRDSKVTAGPELAVTPTAWSEFLVGVASNRR